MSKESKGTTILGNCVDPADNVFIAGFNSEAEFGDLLSNDVAKAENEVRSVTTDLTQQQFDALLILSFNFPIGPRSTPRLRNALIRGDLDAVRREWEGIKYETGGGKKVFSPGLVKRRSIELDVFFNGVYRNR